MASCAPPTAADLAAAAVDLAVAADILEVHEAAYGVADGCKVVDPRRVVVGPGLATVASEKNIGKVLCVCEPMLDAHPEAREPPVLADAIGAAAARGGDGATVTLHAKRLILQSTIEFLFTREGHGGLRYVPGKFLFSPSAFPAEPSAAAPAPVPAGTAAPLPSPEQLGKGGGSRKRSAEALTDELDRFSASEAESSSKHTAGGSEGSQPGDTPALFEMTPQEQVSFV